MASDNAVVGIDIIARLDHFRAEMAKIPDIGGKEAKALVSQLSREIKKAERAATKAASSVAKARKPIRDAATATDRFGDSSGKLASNAARLSGILDVLAPGAGEVARTVGDVADAGEVAAEASKALGLSLSSILSIAAPVAVAVGALALAYQHYKGEVEKAEAAQQQSRDILEDVQTLTEAVAGAKRDLAKAVGGETAMQAQAAEVQERWNRAAMDSNETLRERANQLRETLAEEQELVNNGIPGHIAEVERLKSALRQNAKEQERNADLAKQGAQAELDAAEAGRLRAEADAFVAAKAAEKAKALAAAKAAAAEEEAATKAATSAANAYLDALEGVAAIGHQAERSQMDAYARLADDRQRQLDRITAQKKAAIREAVKAGGDGARAELAAEEAAAAARTKVWDAYYGDLEEQREKDAKAAARRAEDQARDEEAARRAAVEGSLSLTAQVADSTANAFASAYDRMAGDVARLLDYREAADEHLTGSQKRQLDRRIDAQKRAARNAFEAEQAAAAASAAVQTALAVSQALASAPPPFNVGLAALAAAAGLAQEAAIAKTSPTFHAGGALDLAPDELSITARRREFVLNPTGRDAIGDDNLRRANAGMGPQGGDVVAVSVYKHTRQVERWKRDGLVAGDPIARAIERGRMVGHRSNRSR